MRTMVLSSLSCKNVLATAFLEISLFTFESLPSISGIGYDSAGLIILMKESPPHCQSPDPFTL